MNEKYIKRLIRLVEESTVESLEVSSWGRRIKITQRLSPSTNGSGNRALVTEPVVPLDPAPGTAQSAPASPVEQVAASETGLVEIKSPMVGTFYVASSPESDPYVSLNEKVTAGQVVCIVEAMKLMNEIESEVSGRVVKILVENAQPVEFGHVLFLIDPNG